MRQDTHVLICLPLLLRPIPRQARHGAAKRALHPAGGPLLQVLQLALGLLALAALVLPAPLVDHLLVAEEVPRRLLHATHRLVVAALPALLVVLRNAAASADREGSDFGGGVGGLVLGVGLGLGLLGVDLGLS